MTTTPHEIVVDLEQTIPTDDGRRYRPTVVGRAARDGHWDAWIEFIDVGTQDVLRTGVETHQPSDADLRRWSSMLTRVYFEGALARAVPSPTETTIHHCAVERAHQQRRRDAALDPFALAGLGAHVLRRELQLLDATTLRRVIRTHALNRAKVPVTRLTRSQLVTFILTAAEAGRPGLIEQ
jgi:hypothetical protein